MPRHNSIIKRTVFLAVLASLPACPTGFFCSPGVQDFLSAERRVVVSGALFNEVGLIPNQTLECTSTFYQSGSESYMEEGETVSSCNTTTNEVGWFRQTIDLPSAGLYAVRMSLPAEAGGEPIPVEEIISLGDILSPFLGESREVPAGIDSGGEEVYPQLLTFVPGLRPQRDQLVYFDWSFGGHYFDIFNELRRFFLETMEGVTPLQGAWLSTLCMAEVERIFQEYYDGTRVYVVETPDPPQTHTIRMDSADCGEDATILGITLQDFLNERLDQRSNVAVKRHICLMLDNNMVPSIFRGNPRYDPKAYLQARNIDIEDPLERVEDCAYGIAHTAAHELGHSLGLVNSDHLWGEPGSHNPYFTEGYAPDIVNASRSSPWGIMTVWLGNAYTNPDYLTQQCQIYLDPTEEVARCPHFFSLFNWQFVREIQ